MSDKYRNTKEIISNIFDNISAEKMNNAINVTNGWKSVVNTINTNKNKSMGDYLVAHSRVIDLKNNVLLVEADHPGYVQTLKMYNKYIIKGLNNKYPELNIKSLSFRLKGSDIELKNLEKNEIKNQKYTEKEIEDGISVKKELSEDLKSKFEQLKVEFKNRYIDQH